MAEDGAIIGLQSNNPSLSSFFFPLAPPLNPDSRCTYLAKTCFDPAEASGFELPAPIAGSAPAAR